MSDLPKDSEVQPSVDHLQLVNTELQRRKADAEKDRDLFRDLYSKASVHASEVTRENNTLQEHLTLAEGQVREGLGMVKGVYEERVRRLEGEVERWKGLCAVLTAQERRTDDEVRRRAALEPELREENARLREELAKLGRDYHHMEEVLEQLAEHEQADGVPPEPPKVQAVNVATLTSMQVVR